MHVCCSSSDAELHIVHVAARAPRDVFGPWARWERVRLGSESSSGAGAGGGVWKFGSSKSGNLRNWTSRDLGSKPSTKLELQNQNPCRPINQGVPSIGKPSSKLQLGSLYIYTYIIPPSFNQGVPLASSTSCESVPRQYIYMG